MSFRFKNLKQSDADKVLILIEQNRKLKAEIIQIEDRLTKVIRQKDEEIARLKLALKDAGEL